MKRLYRQFKSNIPDLLFFLLMIGWMTPLLVLNDVIKSIRSPKRRRHILVAAILWSGVVYCLFLKIKPSGLTLSQGLEIFAALCSWRLLVLPIVNWSSAEMRTQEDPMELNGRDFYNSRAWQDLRYQTLRKFGKKCMLCGATKGSMHVDHIRPRSKYPEAALDPRNLQILCKSCNFAKGNIYSDDFRESA